MVNNQTPIQFTWHDILWRLALTVLLLLLLAGSSITLFSTVTTHPDTRVLPTLSYDDNGN